MDVRDGPVKTGRPFVRIPEMRGTAILLLGLLAACRSSPPPEAPGHFQERLLAVIPGGADVRVPPAFSPDGRAVAYVAQTPDGSWAVRGEWKSRRLDAL